MITPASGVMVGLGGCLPCLAGRKPTAVAPAVRSRGGVLLLWRWRVARFVAVCQGVVMAWLRRSLFSASAAFQCKVMALVPGYVAQVLLVGSGFAVPQLCAPSGLTQVVLGSTLLLVTLPLMRVLRVCMYPLPSGPPIVSLRPSLHGGAPRVVLEVTPWVGRGLCPCSFFSSVSLSVFWCWRHPSYVVECVPLERCPSVRAILL